MTSVADTLGEFIVAWNAGERPRVADYLGRVPVADRADLAQQIELFVMTAPEPDYDEPTWAEMSSDPMVARAAAAAFEPEPWPTLLPRLRKRAGLSFAQIADRLKVSAPAKAAQLLEEMETGDLAPDRPSRTLLERLGAILGIDPDALDWRGGGLMPQAMAAPAPAPAMMRSSEPLRDHPIDILADALTTDAPDWDDVDELFLSGRE